jgi:lysozyme
MAAVAAIFLSQKARAMSDAANAGAITTPDDQACTIDSSYTPPAVSEWDSNATLPDLNAMQPTTLSDNGLTALQAREGFSAKPYADGTGHSVGYGHFILPGEDFSQGVTQAQALDLLATDTAWAVDCVYQNVTAILSQNAFDALVSFVYNVGKTAFKNSTLLRMINAYDPGASDQFMQWIYTHGSDGVKRIAPALQARRVSEQEQFLL